MKADGKFRRSKLPALLAVMAALIGVAFLFFSGWGSTELWQGILAGLAIASGGAALLVGGRYKELLDELAQAQEAQLLEKRGKRRRKGGRQQSRKEMDGVEEDNGRIAALKAELASLRVGQAETEKLKAELARRENGIMVREANAKRLLDEAAAVKKEADTLLAQAKSATSAVEDSKRELARARQEAGALRTQLEAHRTKSRENAESLKQQAHAVRKERDSALKRLEALRQEAESLGMELNTALNGLEQAKRASQEASAGISALLTALLSQPDLGLKGRNCQVALGLPELSGMAQELSGEIADALAWLKNAHFSAGRNAGLQVEKRLLEEALQAKAALQAVNSELAALRETHRKFQAVFKGRATRLRNLAEKLAESQSRAAQAEDVSQSLRAELQRLEAETPKSLSLIAPLRTALSACDISAAWKFMAGFGGEENGGPGNNADLELALYLLPKGLETAVRCAQTAYAECLSEEEAQDSEARDLYLSLCHLLGGTIERFGLLDWFVRLPPDMTEDVLQEVSPSFVRQLVGCYLTASLAETDAWESLAGVITSTSFTDIRDSLKPAALACLASLAPTLEAKRAAVFGSHALREGAKELNNCVRRIGERSKQPERDPLSWALRRRIVEQEGSQPLFQAAMRAADVIFHLPPQLARELFEAVIGNQHGSGSQALKGSRAELGYDPELILLFADSSPENWRRQGLKRASLYLMEAIASLRYPLPDTSAAAKMARCWDPYTEFILAWAYHHGGKDQAREALRQVEVNATTARNAWQHFQSWLDGQAV